MSHQVALHHRTIFHCQFHTLGLSLLLPLDFSQRKLFGLLFLLILFAVLARLSAAATLGVIHPLFKFSTVDLHASEELREGVEQLALSLRSFNRVSVLRERRLQTVVHSLGQMVVEFLKVFLLDGLLNLRVL